MHRLQADTELIDCWDLSGLLLKIGWNLFQIDYFSWASSPKQSLCGWPSQLYFFSHSPPKLNRRRQIRVNVTTDAPNCVHVWRYSNWSEDDLSKGFSTFMPEGRISLDSVVWLRNMYLKMFVMLGVVMLFLICIFGLRFLIDRTVLLFLVLWCCPEGVTHLRS